MAKKIKTYHPRKGWITIKEEGPVIKKPDLKEVEGKVTSKKTIKEVKNGNDS